MNHKLAKSISVEITKLIKNKTNYIYLFIIGIVVIVPVLGVRQLGSETSPGYSYLLLSLQTLANTILPILLLLFASNAISSEISSGTIRNILISDPSRTRFLVSKIITGLVFQLILIATAIATGVLFAGLLFGFGNIAEDGFIIMNSHQFWASFIFSNILLFVTLIPTITLGIFISIISKNNIAAIVISISSYMLLDIIKIKLHIESFIYSTYIEFPLNTLGELIEGFHPSWTPKLYNCLIISAAWTFIPIILSFLAIRKLEFK